jgi:lipoate-protein ligase A
VELGRKIGNKVSLGGCGWASSVCETAALPRFARRFPSLSAMQLLDLTLATPAENLALDEALLDEAEHSDRPRECLRLWEAHSPLVVVGRNSRIELEVQEEYCRAHAIPILRRTSGGCAIVAGPGCLMYAVVLSYELRPELRMLDEAHRFVLETTLDALRPLVPNVSRQGTSDLTMVGETACGEKFSGNSLRCRRNALLYHGTLLYDFPLELVTRCLKFPPRQPDYRQDRGHESFIANLPVDASAIKAGLVEAWKAEETRSDWPRVEVAAAVVEKFGRAEWNLKR